MSYAQHIFTVYCVLVKHSFTLSHNLVLEGLRTFHPGLLLGREGEGLGAYTQAFAFLQNL